MDSSSVTNSATGIASHAPLIPKNRGSTSSEITVKSRVRQKEMMADDFPSDRAVKKPEEAMLKPLNKKL